VLELEKEGKEEKRRKKRRGLGRNFGAAI